MVRSALNASAAHKANHTIECLYLGTNVVSNDGNAIGDDGAVALARRHEGVAYDVCFLLNMTSILATGAKTLPRYRHDRLHETGTAPSSQCQTCCVARNVSHRKAKRWNIRSDGVCVVCRGIVFAMLITCNP